ncbi:SAM-dependent methyltransferase [Phyllobacterium salinisoli]|uniref:SAM-dependent methyltransferase n=1 Tax=Phyllobacterium salinisoli TaxID=1899321 RepID=A0A368K4T6_9HYPH|nr:SAM-dependent methyltransferase [Phyllobacterium salinisoli]RCS24396.1 SAM-dependent methyltransferase [Phyllobacterium salinisoli]
MSDDKRAAAEDTKTRNPYTDRTSMEFNFRARRFAKVQALIEDALKERGEARILDLGGTETYWLIGEDFINRNKHRIKITMVNLEQEPVRDTALFTSLAGDAASPDLLAGQEFDVVHSNSVIEHVGDWNRMIQFAENTRRLAKRYYVQTPNYWFPYEPHFRTPGFQYLPESVRIALIQRVPLGFFKRIDNYEEARDIIKHHSIISTRQMRFLFKDAVITHEKMMGLNKSIIAVRA